MKPTDSSSRAPFNPAASAPDFLAPLVDLAPPSFPRFPSVEEFLMHAAGTQMHPLLKLTDAAPVEPASLFNGLLGGRLEVLTQDAAAHPDRYDEETRIFLEELDGGARKLKELSPADAEMLDRAVMDFASARPQNKPAPTKDPPKSKKPALLVEEGELPDERAPQVELPNGNTAAAYWWT